MKWHASDIKALEAILSITPGKVWIKVTSDQSNPRDLHYVIMILNDLT